MSYYAIHIKHMSKSLGSSIRQLVKQASVLKLEIILNKKSWEQEFWQEYMSENQYH